MTKKDEQKLRAYRALYLRDGVKAPAPQHIAPGRHYGAQTTTNIVQSKIIKDGKAIDVAAIFRDPDGLGITVINEHGASVEIPLGCIAFAVPE